MSNVSGTITISITDSVELSTTPIACRTRGRTKRTFAPLPEDILKKWMPIDEALAALGKRDKSTIYRMRDSKILQMRTFGGRALVSRASVASYIARYT